jgi:hypothetical protein
VGKKTSPEIDQMLGNRVARFFLVQTYHNGKNIPNNYKLYKRPYIIPNGSKYSKWSLYMTTFSIPRPSKFYPNCDFCFENKPSGNPAVKVGCIIVILRG